MDDTRVEKVGTGVYVHRRTSGVPDPGGSDGGTSVDDRRTPRNRMDRVGLGSRTFGSE